MKRTTITVACIIYTILFVVNLAFTAIDWDDLFLPLSVRYYFIGCTGSGHTSEAYRKGPLYFIDYHQQGPIPVTRDEYKYCTVFMKGQFLNLKKQGYYDSPSHSWSAVYIEFPFREEDNYDLSKTGSFDYKVRSLYLKKTKYPEWMNDAVIRVFEENNVTNGYYMCLLNKKKDGDELYDTEEADYKDAPRNYRDRKDERFRKIHDMYTAEYANLKLCSEGKTKLPYLGRSTTVMEKLVEHESLWTPSKYLHMDDYDQYNIIKYPGLLAKYDDDYLNDAMLTYMKLRYFDHMFKGPHIVYYEIKSYEDMTIMTFVIPAEKKVGYIEFVTNNPLSREKTIQELKLAIKTGGMCPVVKFSNAFMHAMVILMVQNSVFGAVYLFADSRKRKNSEKAHN